MTTQEKGNIDQIKKLNVPKYSEYQKLWGDNPTNEHISNIIDEEGQCIFCERPVSPRSIVLVVKKSLLTSSVPGPKRGESCCSNCANKINSSPIRSPKGLIRRNSLGDLKSSNDRKVVVQRETSCTNLGSESHSSGDVRQSPIRKFSFSAIDKDTTNQEEELKVKNESNNHQSNHQSKNQSQESLCTIQ